MSIPYGQKNQDIGIDENINTYCQKNQSPLDENIKENNKNIINNINNIYSRVIDYLNKKTSKNFKSTTKKTQKFIQARLNDGFIYEDFVRVIDIKSKEWLNNKEMEQYLRPETLFGNKFEGYLNQNSQKKETQTEEKDDISEYIEMSRRYENVQN